MCDYSLEAVQNRAAKVGDDLVATNFGTGSVGLASVHDLKTAICLRPGTELLFPEGIILQHSGAGNRYFIGETLGRFRQINADHQKTHHDAIELGSTGEIILLTRLMTGVRTRVLQLPAEENTAAEAGAKNDNAPAVEMKKEAASSGGADRRILERIRA